MKRARILVLALTLVGTLGLGTIAGAATSPVTQQMNAVAQSLLISTASAGVQSSLSTLTSDNTWDKSPILEGCKQYVVACSFGTGSKVVVIYGDSHAPMWAAAIVPALLAKGFRVDMYWMPGCPPSRIAVNTGTCTTAWRNMVESKVTAAKVKPKAVILIERSTDLTLDNGESVTASQLQASLTASIKVFSSKGSKVIVLGDNPVMMFGSTYSRTYSPAGCVSLHLSNLRTCDTSLTASLTHTLSGAERAAATVAKATFIDTSPWLCSTSKKLCPVIINNKVAYIDAYHLAWTYAATLKDVVGAALATPLGYK